MNALAHETSPYLLQHASNPVDWRPWGPEAFAEARERDVPVLLSVGYSACHWCHVMEHESFSDEATAELMNRLFVSIKVDREERPDVDALYMDAVLSMTGQGGWPMTVFLLPDMRPFYGGTYYPPEPRQGMPSFRQVLEAVDGLWRERRGDLDHLAGRITEALRQAAARPPAAGDPDAGALTDAVAGLRAQHDPEWGGFGGAPKFPPGPVIGFLLREHARSGSQVALEMAVRTLDGMALGGMHDVLGGGFHRYSVDGRWLVPHFEKMLYDNALLAVAYLEGWAVTGDAAYRRVAERTLDYLLRELRRPEGGFASAQDADTDGVEGATFVWTPGQVRDALGAADAEAAVRYYGITEAGNFEGASVLRPAAEPPPNLQDIERRLLEVRLARPQPALDDKVLAAWNGLALAALAQGAWRLGRSDLLEAGHALAAFLEERMRAPDGGLMRTFRAGEARIPGYLDDHAAVAHGLLELHLASGDAGYLRRAGELARLAAERFADPAAGGFFQSSSGGESLVAPRKDIEDNPIPSGNSLMATVLLRLARLEGDAALEQQALGAVRLTLDYARRAPQGFGHALQASDLALAPPREVAVVGAPADPATAALADAVRGGFRPTVAAAFWDGEGQPPVALFEGRTLVDGAPAAYICERFACRRPLTDPERVREALAG
ncbi:MAG TPA: thioredoxin domain-containing protein [Gaiellales bacterium]|nr:thioredoxin domain-containing protein [Gaiellales bacterium]